MQRNVYQTTQLKGYFLNQMPSRQNFASSAKKNQNTTKTRKYVLILDKPNT